MEAQNQASLGDAFRQELADIKNQLSKLVQVKPMEEWLPAKDAIEHPRIKGQGLTHARQLTSTARCCGLLREGTEYRRAVGGRDWEFEVSKTGDRLSWFGRLSEDERRRKFGLVRLPINYRSQVNV